MITTTNFLDAYWMIGVGRIRIVGAAQLLDNSYDLVVAHFGNSQAGVACPGGGNLDYTVSGSTRTITYHGCNFGARMPLVVRSGSITTSDAVMLDYTGTLGPKLYSGQFAFASVVYATTDTGSPAFGVDERADSTVVGYNRRSIGLLDVDVYGVLGVTRSGRSDSYTIQGGTQIRSSAGGLDITHGVFGVTSPRFLAAAQEISLIEDAGVSTVIAHDQSQVAGTPAGGSGTRYVVRASTGGSVLLDTTLTTGSAGVVAAVTKALQ